MKTFLILISALLLGSVATATPVERNGLLSTQGNRIVGQHGKPVSLAGNSLFWSQWEDEWWNSQCIEWLKQDWEISVIRAAMGVEANGYLKHRAVEQAKVARVVDAAIAAGIYVIIDWHDHRAEQHEAESIAFFQTVARKYGHQPNVIYEIYNEPLAAVSWKNDVKPYAERLISAIRAIDPDNLILVGSPNWSQDVDVAAADPITDTNIAYTLHFYAGTHKEKLRKKAETALRAGVALFVSEWGTCDANGDGKVDLASTADWMEFMRTWQLSHCNWAVSDKREAASIVRPGASASGRWQESELTESGRVVRAWTKKWAQLFPGGTMVE